jgi:hypothetical protein
VQPQVAVAAAPHQEPVLQEVPQEDTDSDGDPALHHELMLEGEVEIPQNDSSIPHYPAPVQPPQLDPVSERIVGTCDVLIGSAHTLMGCDDMGYEDTFSIPAGMLVDPDDGQGQGTQGQSTSAANAKPSSSSSSDDEDEQRGKCVSAPGESQGQGTSAANAKPFSSSDDEEYDEYLRRERERKGKYRRKE